jgi:trk system potassium uptake protein TrkA
MYIVIAGGGKIGAFLAKSLSLKGHKITLIEKKPETAKYLSENLNVMIINGDSSDLSTLSDINLESADRFVAVSGSDEDNLVSCQLAKTLYKVPITIARINDPRNEKVSKAFEVDISLNITDFMVKMVEEGILFSDLIPLISLGRGDFVIVEIKIGEFSKVAGKQIKGLNIPEGALIISILRNKDVIIPSGNEKLEKDDLIVVLVRPEEEESLKKVLNHEQ